MAESQCKAVEIKSAELLHRLTAIFADAQIHYFLTASVPLIVMPCVPRTLHSFVPQSLRSLHNLCLHGIRPAKMFCGGKAVAGLCLLFVLALCLASSPRNPRTLARARVVLTLISVVVKFI